MANQLFFTFIFYLFFLAVLLYFILFHLICWAIWIFTRCYYTTFTIEWVLLYCIDILVSMKTAGYIHT